MMRHHGHDGGTAMHHPGEGLDADELEAKKHSLLELMQFAKGGMAREMKERHAGGAAHPPAGALESMVHGEHPEGGEMDEPHSEEHALAGGGSGHSAESNEDMSEEAEGPEDPSIPGAEASDDPKYEEEAKREEAEDASMHGQRAVSGGPMGPKVQTPHPHHLMVSLQEHLRAKAGKR